ncbi:MAG: GNAT family N-acetyltransferase [Methylacidiphilales bacterium]|nr:GNAT family N-acetyltransferase [Candidatus Methylacidiphilales bacterium]
MKKSITVNTHEAYFNTLQEAAPYVRNHNAALFVIHIPIDCCHDTVLESIVKEIKIIHRFGSRLLVVHGSSFDAVAHVPKKNIERYQRESRDVRYRIEKYLGDEYSVINGTATVSCKPVGVVEGIEHRYQGTILIRSPDLLKQSARKSVLLYSPIASYQSNQLVLNSYQVAVDFATALSAKKLILYSSKRSLFSAQLSSQVTVHEISSWLKVRIKNYKNLSSIIEQAIYGNVKRVHLVNGLRSNGLLTELYTKSGSGVLIRKGAHHSIRRATKQDISSIKWLLMNPNTKNYFLKRTDAYLEKNYNRFLVAISEGALVGTCEIILFRTSHMAELGAVCVQQEFANKGIVKMLINRAENELVALGYHTVFVLTTKAEDFFTRLGYRRTGFESLPLVRQKKYDRKRNSIILIKKFE